MRICGGEFRGRVLASFSGMSIRPTPEQVREAIFNIVGQDLRGALVLDLFAGSGILGIEAVSRGASRALLVDKSPQALSLIRKNIEILQLQNRIKILRHDLNRGLAPVLKVMPAFNLVFLDPPYGKDLAMPVLNKLDVCEGLMEDGTIIVEHFSKELTCISLGSLHVGSRRIYGQTALSFLKKRRVVL